MKSRLGRLTLNAGLRYDVEEPRTERYNRFATFDFQRSVPHPGSRNVACEAC